MRKNLNKRGRIVAAATTGAILAGTAGIAYFVSTSQDSGAATGGTMSITASVGDSTTELYPVGDLDDNGFTLNDVLGAEAGGASMAINVPLTTEDGVQTEIGLTGLSMDVAQDLWITFCDTDALRLEDCSALMEISTITPGTDSWNIISVIGENDGASVASFSKTAWVFLRNDEVNQQAQGLTSLLTFDFEARTTGDFS